MGPQLCCDPIAEQTRMHHERPEVNSVSLDDWSPGQIRRLVCSREGGPAPYGGVIVVLTDFRSTYAAGFRSPHSGVVRGLAFESASYRCRRSQHLSAMTERRYADFFALLAHAVAHLPLELSDGLPRVQVIQGLESRSSRSPSATFGATYASATAEASAGRHGGQGAEKSKPSHCGPVGATAEVVA